MKNGIHITGNDMLQHLMSCGLFQQSKGYYNTNDFRIAFSSGIRLQVQINCALSSSMVGTQHSYVRKCIKAGRTEVLFPNMSLDISTDLILPAIPWP
jgi:hypothetical protein